MKLLSIISILGALTSCTSNISDQKQIMETIESRIQLPEGARPIEAYSRNYARLPDNKILAVYIEPRERSSIDATEDYGCEVMGSIDENGELESRPCTEDELEETKEMENAISESQGNANSSRWFKNSHDLPVMSDGGCLLIEVIFDLRSDSFDHVLCNGSY